MRRASAFIVDAIILGLLSAATNIPGFGILPAIVSVLYLLLRDYNGASAGKRIMRLKVVSQNGSPATTKQCIVRNLLFVPPGLALFVPAFGFVFDNVVTFVLYFIEFVLLLTTGSRLGDKIAGTTVVKN